MEAFPEVIITSGSSCSVYDSGNSNLVYNYKVKDIAPKTLSMIGEDFLIGAEIKKPKLMAWSISKSKSADVLSMFVPGIVSVMTVSSCGIYCIAGIAESIYIWETNSGELLNIVKRHYQDVTSLHFTADDSRFLSGGKDGHVIVWILSQVTGIHIDRDAVKPHFVWNSHSAEVTDISSCSFVSRVTTTSLDMTCKVYELDSGILLSTICMDAPLTAVVMDPLAYFIFLGDNRGSLYKIETYEKLPREMHINSINKTELRIHGAKIFSMSVSFNGNRLMTASEDGTCKMWDIHSMARLLEITPEGSFTNSLLTLKPTSLSKANIAPPFLLRNFAKEFADPEKKKFIPTTTYFRPQTLMHAGRIDNYYESAILGNVSATVTDISCPGEDIFQHSTNGESMGSMKVVNNQLFSYTLQRQFEKLPRVPE